jgi:uncharacterized membrane protein YhaH (DUF805 family)
VTFSGRASRSEFWYWTLFAFLVAVVSGIIDSALFPSMITSPISAITALLLFLPGLAMSVRRLHDLDRTGWWMLIALTFIGLIVLLVWDCIKGTDGPNRFGPDPLAGAKL